MLAYPKPAPRIVDPEAAKRKLLLDPWCRACGRRAANCHHLLGKGGRRGDDDEDNLIPLCGSGSDGCHGALHGNPYTDRLGRRWTAREVRVRIGLALLPSEYAYVVEKLSQPQAAAFLAANYYVELVRLMPLELREVK